MNIAYILQTVRQICTPWQWQKGSDTEELRASLKQHVDGSVHLFGSGRESLLALFKALKLPSGSEIIIQGYTCAALPNAIHAAGCTPIYADINLQTLNLDAETVERAITDRTRVIICQHTFGIPTDTKTLKNLCTTRNIVLIEDCAHVFPDDSHTNIGREGDFLMFSFGRDKAISGITGGAIVSRNNDVSIVLQTKEHSAIQVSHLFIARLLCYPLAYFVLRPFYGIFIGKALLWILGKLHVLPAVLTTKEKQGFQSPTLHKLPNACAALALWELSHLKEINNHRKALTKLYAESIFTPLIKEHAQHFVLLKFPILRNDADRIRSMLKRHNIHLEDGWTGAVVCPRSVDQLAENYESGDCPNAEEVISKVITLPTHPTMSIKQARRLVEIVETLEKNVEY